MRKLIQLIFLILPLFLASCSGNKSTDLTTNQLRGNVKSCNISSWPLIITDSIGDFEYENKSYITGPEKFTFNKSFTETGEIIKECKIIRGKTGWYGAKCNFNNETELLLTVEGAKETYQFYKFDDNNNVVERIRAIGENGNKEITSWEQLKYNSKNQLIIVYGFSDEQKGFVPKTEYKYENDLRSIKNELRLNSDNKPETYAQIIYDYPEIDDQGNWITRIELKEDTSKDKAPFRLTTREIKYY